MLQFTKRALSAFLALVMVFTMLPLQVWAEEVGSQDSDNSVNLAGLYGGVKAEEKVAARIDLDAASALLPVGQTHTFTPTLYDENGEQMEGAEYVWASSNTEIATVSGGQVTGVKEGVATITCQYGSLQTEAMVTVTAASYQLTYVIDYPDDANKFVYENGSTSAIAVPKDTTINFTHAPNERVTIPDNLADTINYDLVAFEEDGTRFEPGDTIEMTQNRRLTSVWEKKAGDDSGGKPEKKKIVVNYHDKYGNIPMDSRGINGKKIVDAIVSEHLGSATVTFLTFNNQDTIWEIDPAMCGWRIDGSHYEYNQQVTVTTSNKEGVWVDNKEGYKRLWAVDVYPRYADLKEGTAAAQFFVRKLNGNTGNQIANYFSVGGGLIETDSSWSDEALEKGVPADGKIIKAPSITEIANLMNTSVPEGAAVRWYQIAKSNDDRQYGGNGFHVDGEIYIKGKYWNVRFVDPDSGKVVHQQLVEDLKTIASENIIDGNGLNTQLREFKWWSFTKDGEKADLTSPVNQDITLYAVFERYTGYTVRHLFEDLHERYEVKETETFRAKPGEDTNAKAKPVEGFTAQKFDQKKVAADGKTTIDIKYNRNSYDVIYTITGNAPTGVEIPKTKTYKFGATVTQEAKPQKEGYSFDGWEETVLEGESPVGIAKGKFTMPDRDVTFTGSFSVPESQMYAVRANIYLGNDANKQLLGTKDELNISFTDLQSRYGEDGYELANHYWNLNLTDNGEMLPAQWNPSQPDAGKMYTNGTDENEFHIVNIHLNEDNPALVTLTYEANAGKDKVENMPDPQSEKYLKGTEVTVASAPTRENYTFSGWKDSSGTSYPANSKIKLTDNTTLYAQWKADTAAYEVQYWFQNADGSGYVQREDAPGYQRTGTIGQTITPDKLSDDKIPAGFAFGRMDENVTIAADGNAVAKVYYDRETYKISYALEGNVKPEGANVPDPSTGRYGAVITIAGDLFVDGYTFTGWYTKEGAKVEVGEKDSNFTMPAGDVTLYGKFSKRTDLSYTVNYLWNGTAQKVRPSDTYNDGTFGETVAVKVSEVENCTPVSSDDIMLTITADEDKNVVNIYYYKNVTLTANSDNNRVYDGEPQSLSGYTASVKDLTFSGVKAPTASGTNAGKYNLTFEKDTVGKADSTGKYIVAAVTPGTLTIKKLPVTVTAPAIEKSYGEPVGNLTATKSAAGGVAIPADFEGVVTYTLAHDGGETPNVGKYPIYFEIDGQEIKKAVTDKDSYQNYEVTFVPGTLTVTAAEGLTFQAEGYNGVYDGRDHSATASSNIPGTTFRYKVGDGEWQNDAPSIKDVGSLTVAVQAINDNYQPAGEQTVELVVTQRPVTLTSQGASKMYDGTPLSKEEVVPTTTLEDKQPWVNGEGVEFYNFAQRTAVTDEQGVDNSFDYKSKPGTNLDNYAIEKVYGKLVVTPSNALTVVATGEEWTYDGIERSPEVQVKIGDQEIQDAEVLYSKDGIAWSKTPIKAKNVSESGTFRVKAQYPNYQAAEATYTMTVSERAVTIQSADGEQVYNGTPLKVETVNVVAGSFVEGEGLNYTGFTAQTDVTDPTVDNKYSYSCAEGTLAGNYIITQRFGKLTVKPAAATVKVNSIENHVYDGSVPEVTAMVEGVLEQDRWKIQYELTWNKLADAGTYDVTFQDPKTTQGNYMVTFVDGTVTIDPKPVKVKAVNPPSVVYGSELPELAIDKDDLQEQMAEGDSVDLITYTLAYNETNFRDGKALVGEHEIMFVKQKEAQGNYKVSFEPAKLIVTAPGDLDDSVLKTHEGQNFKVGDTVTFKITVTNIYAGKATVKLEEMAGMTFGNGQTALEDVLEPGETKTYTATRILTEQDFENGGVSNTVKVTLDPEKDGEPEIPGTDTDEVPLESKPDMSVVKTVLNPKESYQVGDTIRYQITVTNTGNVPLHDLELTDVMNADGKVTFPAGTVLTRDTLDVGGSWTVTCSYVVRDADEGKTLSNTAKVITHKPGTDDPVVDEEDRTDGEPVEKRYSLTIHYRNEQGAAVANSYTGRFHAGDSFKIDSPVVAGYYAPRIASIASPESGMPAQDLEYVVTYTAIPAPVDPDPDGPNPGPNVPDDDDDDDDTPPVPDPEQEQPQPPEPEDFVIDPNDYTLTEVEDNETPLANMDLDGHTCCIMHLLLMLAAMVVLGFYTKSRKKHQARIFELKRMLAMEEDHSDDPEQP